MKTIAIMQPTYLPWIGYFDLIDRTDQFVFLDSVQFEPRSWQQRNRIKSPAGAQWISVPVLSKGRRDQSIVAVETDPTQPFQQKHWKAISFYYAKAPYFAQYKDELEEFYKCPAQILSDWTISLIEWFSEKLGLWAPDRFLRSSRLPVSGHKTELLVDLCKHLKADKYLSAAGSREYIEENNLFIESNISLDYHAYSHPSYRQLHGTFVPHLAIIDLLLNEGPQSLPILRSGRPATAARH